MQPRWISILVGSLLLLTTVAHSQGLFERLVMPGPLIEGHAKLEQDCNNCHEPFVRQSQTRLCLACHKMIASDRQNRQGFHGHHPEASKAECRVCHTDHKGRPFDIVQLNREIFNHAFTNFALKGAHKRASCEGCHVTSVKYREAPGRCFDCHTRAYERKKRCCGVKPSIGPDGLRASALSSAW